MNQNKAPLWSIVLLIYMIITSIGAPLTVLLINKEITVLEGLILFCTGPMIIPFIGFMNLIHYL